MNSVPQKAETAAGSAGRDTFQEFLNDIKPMLYGQRLSYVDVGAYIGDTYNDLLKAGFRPDEVLLIEPNPASARKLKESIQDWDSAKTLKVYELALGDGRDRLTLRAANDMTRVEDPSVQGSAFSGKESSDVFEVASTTLDSLADDLLVPHISILKLDVEGHELHVFKGATDLLQNNRVDIIYVEAGLDEENKQQCYYRDIEDALSVYGYRSFRFYEQKHEWMEDSPFLRRTNIAFLSAEFARNHPLRLSQALFEATEEARKKTAQVAEMEADYVEKERLSSEENQRLRKRIAKLEGEVGAAQCQVNEVLAHRTQLALHLEKANVAYKAFAGNLNAEYEGALSSILGAHQRVMQDCQARHSEVIRDLIEKHNQRINSIVKEFNSFARQYESLKAAANWYRDSYHKLLTSRSWRLGGMFRIPGLMYRKGRAFVLRRPLQRRNANAPAIESFDEAARDAARRLMKLGRRAEQNSLTEASLLAATELRKPQLTVKVETYMSPETTNGSTAEALRAGDQAAAQERQKWAVERLRFQLTQARDELAFYKSLVDGMDDASRPSGE